MWQVLTFGQSSGKRGNLLAKETRHIFCQGIITNRLIILPRFLLCPEGKGLLLGCKSGIELKMTLLALIFNQMRVKADRGAPLGRYNFI